jgi:hypothetical protein
MLRKTEHRFIFVAVKCIIDSFVAVFSTDLATHGPHTRTAITKERTNSLFTITMSSKAPSSIAIKSVRNAVAKLDPLFLGQGKEKSQQGQSKSKSNSKPNSKPKWKQTTLAETKTSTLTATTNATAETTPTFSHAVTQSTLPTPGPLTNVTRVWSMPPSTPMFSASVVDEPMCTRLPLPTKETVQSQLKIRSTIPWRFEYKPKTNPLVPGTLADQRAAAYNVFILLLSDEPVYWDRRKEWCDFSIHQNTPIGVAATWTVSAKHPRGRLCWYVRDKIRDKWINGDPAVLEETRPLRELEALLVDAHGIFTIDWDWTRATLRSTPIFQVQADGKGLAEHARRVAAPLERLTDPEWTARDPMRPGTADAKVKVRPPLESEAESVMVPKRKLPDSLAELERMVMGLAHTAPPFTGPPLHTVKDADLKEMRPVLWKGTKTADEYIPDQLLMHIGAKMRGLGTDLGLWKPDLGDIVKWNAEQPWFLEKEETWARMHGAGCYKNCTPVKESLTRDATRVFQSIKSLSNYMGMQMYKHVREQLAMQLVMLVDLCNAAYGFQRPILISRMDKSAQARGSGREITEHVTLTWTSMSVKIDTRVRGASFQAQENKRMLERVENVVGVEGIDLDDESMVGTEQKQKQQQQGAGRLLSVPTTAVPLALVGARSGLRAGGSTSVSSGLFSGGSSSVSSGLFSGSSTSVSSGLRAGGSSSVSSGLYAGVASSSKTVSNPGPSPVQPPPPPPQLRPPVSKPAIESFEDLF